MLYISCRKPNAMSLKIHEAQTEALVLTVTVLETGTLGDDKDVKVETS